MDDECKILVSTCRKCLGFGIGVYREREGGATLEPVGPNGELLKTATALWPCLRMAGGGGAGLSGVRGVVCRPLAARLSAAERF